METRRIVSIVFIAGLLILGACATSPEAEMRRQNMEADIDEILTSDLRALTIRFLQDLSYPDVIEQYQTKFKAPAPIMVHNASGETLPFSRS